MSDLTGLDQLEQRQQVASSRAKRHVPPAKHPKAPIKRSPEGAGTQEESSPTRPERREPSAAPTGAEAQSPPVLRRRSRVRPTQVHLDETAEDHLSALKKRAVNADVALTASAVLRMALAELVERYGYDRIVEMFAEDASQLRPGRPIRKESARS